MLSTSAAYVVTSKGDLMTTPYENLFLRASMALSREQARKILADAKKLTPRSHLSTTDNNADETIC